ncbi:hypothetical protein [Facklamia hominis]|uniref:hypothetical protein n=1 Tax=Facklamia hominis TaxID=178214 RepID=UPI00101B9F06|nr:hypothetical protein [Facklamia hominis]RYC97867.1 hypothetical protein EKN08_05785 [Facklamia hominis]
MAEVFGFDEAAQMFDKIADKTDEGRKTTEKYQEKMMERARSNFAAGLHQRTGQGQAGIDKQTSGDTYEVGWSARPGLHGYFHELGFHALDNRGGRKYRLRRDSKGKRKRSYRRVTATYVPPTPHMRPAFYDLKDEYLAEAQRNLVP